MKGLQCNCWTLQKIVGATVSHVIIVNSPICISCSLHNQASLLDSNIMSTTFELQCHGWDGRSEGEVKAWDTIKSMFLEVNKNSVTAH